MNVDTLFTKIKNVYQQEWQKEIQPDYKMLIIIYVQNCTQLDALQF